MKKVNQWEKDIAEAILLDNEKGICECCEKVDIIVTCGSRRLDVDHNLHLCPYCAEDHNKKWDAQWEEYYSNIL